MTPAEIVQRRLDAQRIGATTFSKAEDVVAALGAVQAQDYLGALWAVGLRLLEAREPDVERAIAERRIVRTWPLRGTLHFVAPADARWMIEHLSPRRVAAASTRFRQLGLDDGAFARARRVLVKSLEGGKPLARPLVYRALERAGISTAGQRGIHILWRLAQECLLCFGPREGKQHTFVLFDEWIAPTPKRTREEALAELAARYFAGHGPATAMDFAWWSGIGLADARTAIQLAGARLASMRVDDGAYWFAADKTPSSGRRPRAYLLPAFDELLVGYTDRSAALKPEHRLRVNDGGGILKPSILLDRTVVGTWKRCLGRREVTFSADLFGSLSAPESREIAKAWKRYAQFVGREPHAWP